MTPAEGVSSPAAQMGMARSGPFARALIAAAERREDIIGLTADLARYTDMEAFFERFPDRAINVGMAEQNLVSVAAGLAMSGLTPVATTFAAFLTRRAHDFTIMQVALGGAPVKLIGCLPGVTQAFGASHTSIDDIATMRAVPGMVVIDPCDPAELEQATAAAIDYDGPVYLRKVAGREPAVIEPVAHAFRLGRATTLRRGTDVALVASSIMVEASVRAAAQLEAEGVSASVTNVSTVKPFDQETILELAEQTGAVVTAENHSVIGGLFSCVAETLCRHGVRARVIPVGVDDVFPPFGSVELLVTRLGMTADDIAGAARAVLE